MYCDNCGSKIDGRKKFCDNCGAMIKTATHSDYTKVEEDSNSEEKLLPYQPTPPPLPVKSLGIVLLISIIPGFGHHFLGKHKRGALHFGISFLFVVIAFILRGENYITASTIIFGIIGPLIVLAIIDAILLAKRYNKFVKKKLRAPRKRDKW